MKMQTVFNRAAKHLLTQGRKSRGIRKNETGFTENCCLYRGPNGLKCALGGLIFDKYYNKALETKSILNEEVKRALALSLKLHNVDGDLGVLLGELQDIHDCSWPSTWQSRLNTLAKKYKLKPFIKAA